MEAPMEKGPLTYTPITHDNKNAIIIEFDNFSLL